MLNRRGGELFDPAAPPPVPVTLPELTFLNGAAEIDIEAVERREVAAKFAEHRIVAKGRDAWAALARTERETFDKWRLVSAALYCGRNHALRVSGADAPNGVRYTKALTDWLTKNFGDRPMSKATRYWCCRLHEHLPDVERWRATLPESRRAKLINPLSVCRAWLRATQPRSRCSTDPVEAAEAAWRRFRSCLERLPASEARPLWQSAAAEATAHL